MDDLSRVIAKLMAEDDTQEQNEAPPAENGRREEDKMALLLALSAHVSGERREKIEKIYSCVNTAYSIRSMLSLFGGLMDV